MHPSLENYDVKFFSKPLSVGSMTSFYVELSFNITFSLFVILHIGLFFYGKKKDF